MKPLRHPVAHGFSLVEVTLALGIVAFALVGIMGLLPTGLASIKSANEQAGAASTLAALSDALRKAQPNPTNSSVRSFQFGGQTITYNIGGPGTNFTWTNLNLDGNVASAWESPRLSARLQILEPPGTNHTPGRALVTVAWSALSNPGWDSTSNRWTNADGFLVNGMIFLPKP